jgi:phosphoglycolate phosphatase
VRTMIGDGVGQLIARALVATGCRVDPKVAVQRYLAHYEADPTACTSVYPGVRSTLETLRSQGKTLAVLTNKLTRSTQLVLEQLALAPYFARVVSGDSLPFRKPDPRALLDIVEGFGARPDACLMVGDSEVDAQTAQAARVPFVLVTYGYHRIPLGEIPSSAALEDFAALARLLATRQ